MSHVDFQGISSACIFLILILCTNLHAVSFSFTSPACVPFCSIASFYWKCGLGWTTQTTACMPFQYDCAVRPWSWELSNGNFSSLSCNHILQFNLDCAFLGLKNQDVWHLPILPLSCNKFRSVWHNSMQLDWFGACWLLLITLFSFKHLQNCLWFVPGVFMDVKQSYMSYLTWVNSGIPRSMEPAQILPKVPWEKICFSCCIFWIFYVP